MLANFVLWRDARADAGFAMLLAGDIAESIAKRLRMYVLRSKVTIADVSRETQRVGVGGPDGGDGASRGVRVRSPRSSKRDVRARSRSWACRGRASSCWRPRPSADLRARFASLAAPAGFDAWRWLTIRAGVPVITAATQDAFVAQAANLDVLGGIDFQKGCYTGQEIIARTQYLGRLKERTYLFHAEGRDVAPANGSTAPPSSEQPCGTVVNAAPAPGGGSDLLAVVQIAAADAAMRAFVRPTVRALARAAASLCDPAAERAARTHRLKRSPCGARRQRASTSTTGSPPIRPALETGSARSSPTSRREPASPERCSREATIRPPGWRPTLRSLAPRPSGASSTALAQEHGAAALTTGRRRHVEEFAPLPSRPARRGRPKS